MERNTPRALSPCLSSERPSLAQRMEWEFTLNRGLAPEAHSENWLQRLDLPSFFSAGVWQTIHFHVPPDPAESPGWDTSVR